MVQSDNATEPYLKGGYHPEYEGFPKDPKNPKVKQADTIMLHYPLGIEMEPQVRRQLQMAPTDSNGTDNNGRQLPQLLANDLTFYDPITGVSGPAMTWSLFAIGWIRQGPHRHSALPFVVSR